MSLIIPGPEQIGDGLVPATSITQAAFIHKPVLSFFVVVVVVVMFLHKLGVTSECTALYYLPEVTDRFWPMDFMACGGP